MYLCISFPFPLVPLGATTANHFPQHPLLSRPPPGCPSLDLRIFCGLTLSLLPGTSIINTLWPAYLSKQSQPCLTSSTSPVLLYRWCMWESCIWSKAISPSVIKCTNTNAIFPQKSSLNSILLRLNSLFKRPEKKHSHKQQTGLWTLLIFILKMPIPVLCFIWHSAMYRRTLEHG